MDIVTLTSDYGEKDYHVSVIKGALLSVNKKIQIIDISHQIDNYNIVEAAFILQNAWRSFPKGTIHLVTVNNHPDPLIDFIAVEYEGHYFIGPDNGLFSIVFEGLPEEIYILPNVGDEAARLRSYFSFAVGHLTSGKPLHEIGFLHPNPEERLTFQPVTSPSSIRGSVIYIDNFGNAIVNITRQLFDQIGNQRAFRLYVKRNEPITEIHKQYFDVPIGEILCRFNSLGCIELAANMAKASALLGLSIDDSIQIEFSN
jgi:S-adenosyl-L-methionine hydrolase (adenosine-forming)